LSRAIIPSSLKALFFLYQLLFPAGVSQFGREPFENTAGYDAAFPPQPFYGTDGEFPPGMGGPKFRRLCARPAGKSRGGFFRNRACSFGIHRYPLPWDASSMPYFPLLCPEKEAAPV
jgi:hypothetical protein